VPRREADALFRDFAKVPLKRTFPASSPRISPEKTVSAASRRPQISPQTCIPLSHRILDSQFRQKAVFMRVNSRQGVRPAKLCESSITFYRLKQFSPAVRKRRTLVFAPNIAFSKALPNWHGGCYVSCAWSMAGAVCSFKSGSQSSFQRAHQQGAQFFVVEGKEL
jgi:hypothetical protein